MAGRRILAAALGGLALIGAVGAPGAGAGTFSVSCNLSHRLADDPIVFPHHHGAAHSHEFYANRSTNGHSTLASLQRGSTTCRRPEDRSGYWIPTLYKYGTPVPAPGMTIYYRSGGRNPATIEALPDGLQMIAGDADAKEVQDDDIVDWTCSSGETFDDTVLGLGSAKHHVRKARARVRRLRGRRDALRSGSASAARGRKLTATKRSLRLARKDLAEARLDLKPSSLPSCSGGYRIHLSLQFPDCWNGSSLDSGDHRSHMAYSDWWDGEQRCPPSHPVAVPALTFSISWPIANGRGARLASGAVRTMHGDVFSAWDPGTQASHVDRCLKADVDCGSN